MEQVLVAGEAGEQPRNPTDGLIDVHTSDFAAKAANANAELSPLGFLETSGKAIGHCERHNYRHAWLAVLHILVPRHS
jgi:hypothetical protein